VTRFGGAICFTNEIESRFRDVGVDFGTRFLAHAQKHALSVRIIEPDDYDGTSWALQIGIGSAQK
jgi:hypothetical protein